MKKCPVCEETKDLTEFYKYFSKPRNKHRYSNYCKPCAREKAKPRAKKHFEQNKEAKLQYAKDYRKANPEKVKKLSAKFTKKYREELQDCYVAEFAAKSLKCPTDQIHSNPELLQAYRANMKLKREIRKYGKK